MILRALGHPADRCGLTALQQSSPKRSLWTIDLAFILQGFGVSCKLLTANPGARAEYAHEAFYEATLSEDSRRVQALFERAEAAGVDVECRSLSSDALQDMVRPGSVTMALVVRAAPLAPARATG